MRAAARHLHTSQPAVSQVVKAAEDRLGLLLFVREGGRVTPTPEALELFDEFELVFSSVESAQRLASILPQGAGRVMRIGAIPSLATALMPEAVARLKEIYPRVRVWMRSQEPMSVREAIVRREFDLGIIFAEMLPEGFETYDLCTAPIVCLMPAGHPLAGEPFLTTRQLAPEPLISHAQFSPIGEDLDRIFAEDGVERRIVVQVGNSHAATGFVRAGLGIALIDPFFLAAGLPDDLVIRPFWPGRLLTPRLVHVTGRNMNKIERCFFDQLRACAQHFVEAHRRYWEREGVPVGPALPSLT
jgi:DNA-binding transcriptional LysR family regulator